MSDVHSAVIDVLPVADWRDPVHQSLIPRAPLANFPTFRLFAAAARALLRYRVAVHPGGLRLSSSILFGPVLPLESGCPCCGHPEFALNDMMLFQAHDPPARDRLVPGKVSWAPCPQAPSMPQVVDFFSLGIPRVAS